MIAVKRSSIHSKGVFASQDIPKGAKIIEYVGKKVTKAQADEVSDRDIYAHSADNENGAVYLFELNNKYDLDGNVPWNKARLINHSCDPNCEAEIINGEVWIIAIKDIPKGEELSYNYGYDVDNFEDHPCRCGARNCIGYIVEEEQWPKLRKLLKKSSL